MKLNKELTKKFNKISKVVQLDKFLHSEQYYFDNGQVEEMVDIRKENMKYTVIKLNTDIENEHYLVFMIIHANDRAVTHQLKKSFHHAITTNDYFKSLCTYIENNSNSEIIDRCYHELSEFSKKSFIIKLLGV